jgi:hypothetical protein
MRARWLILGVVAAAACQDSSSVTPTTPTEPAFRNELFHGQGQGAPHLFLPRGQVRSDAGRAGGRVLLSNHGGGVLTSSSVTAIFWGNSWQNATFVGDKVTGLDGFFGGMAQSGYAKTCDEYSSITPAVAYAGHLFDYSAAPSSGPSVSTVVGEVCAVLTTNHVTPQTNTLYMVYGDTPRGTAGYCAYHSYGSCGGTQVQVGWSFNLDGDAGCNPQDTQTTHSEGLAALANVTAHELSETRTDPELNAWFDASGNENGDKCAWTFASTLETLANSTQWKLQAEWSNNAYLAATGLANGKGQHGCIVSGS